MGFVDFIRPTRRKFITFLIIFIFWVPVLLRDLMSFWGLILTIIALPIYFPVFIIGILFFSQSGFIGPSLEMAGIFTITSLAVIWAWIISCTISGQK